MTKYRPYKKPKKIDYIKEETIAVDNHIENLQKIPDYRNISSKEFYKSAKLIYDSGWSATTHELIPEATSIETGVLLPERALYSFSASLNISEIFLPYLKVEVLARTNQDVLIEGVYAFNRTAYKPVLFNLYNWQGVTYSTGCQAFGDPPVSPSPIDMYIYQSIPPSGFYFIYPSNDFPVPVGEDITYTVPHKELIGFNNAIKACANSAGAGQYWVDSGEVEFHTLVQKFGYEGAKDIVDEFFDGIVYTEESVPYKAFETIEEERVVTGHQVKKFIKDGENTFTLTVDGSFLQISESVDETAYSNEEFPTYQPNAGDMEVKLNIYSINPNVYSERKYYTK